MHISNPYIVERHVIQLSNQWDGEKIELCMAWHTHGT